MDVPVTEHRIVVPPRRAIAPVGSASSPGPPAPPGAGGRRRGPMRALPWAARLLLVVAVLDVALAGIVGVVCRLGGWGQRADYAHGLVYAGVALLAGGMLRYVGVASDAP